MRIFVAERNESLAAKRRHSTIFRTYGVNKIRKKNQGITAQRKCAYYPHGIGESVCECLFEKGLCLPSGTAMTEGDLERVIEVIKTNLGIEGFKNLGIEG